ncbi:MAG: zf-TFIIB domain-containing protein, partial [Acidobacteriota bacterium]
MNCPNCRNIELTRREIEPNLWAMACEHCRGRWLSNSAYDGWLKSHEHLPLIPSKKLKVSIPEFE